MITPKAPPWYKPDPTRPQISCTPYTGVGDYFLVRTKSKHGMGSYTSLCRCVGPEPEKDIEKLCDGWPDSIIFLLAQDLTKDSVKETLSHILYLMEQRP